MQKDTTTTLKAVGDIFVNLYAQLTPPFYAEFFLHHEGKKMNDSYHQWLQTPAEQFHSTPETQTDESYTHPEDIEHFAQHREIERNEAEKEARFQGISVAEVLDQMQMGSTPPNSGDPSHDQDAHAPPAGGPPKPKIMRQTPPERQDPSVKFAGAAREKDKQSEWGQGSEGYKTPKNPLDKMRYERNFWLFIDPDPSLIEKTFRTR